jgi:hypothetical protein
VGQEGEAAGGFNLIGDPVPVPDALQGDGGAIGEVLKESLDGPRLMVEPVLDKKAAVLIQNGELRVVLVSVTTDLIIHGSCTFLCLRARRKPNCDEGSGRCSAFI